MTQKITTLANIYSGQSLRTRVEDDPKGHFPIIQMKDVSTTKGLTTSRLSKIRLKPGSLPRLVRNEAIDTYAALANEGFDYEDIDGTIANIDEEIRKLADLHTNVWKIFKEVKNKADTESLQRLWPLITYRMKK